MDMKCPWQLRTWVASSASWYKSWRVKLVADQCSRNSPSTGFDLGRFDKAGMCDRDRMQDTFERFLPEFQKALQLGKFGAEI
jgi:hypothetical protein